MRKLYLICFLSIASFCYSQVSIFGFYNKGEYTGYRLRSDMKGVQGVAVRVPRVWNTIQHHTENNCEIFNKFLEMASFLLREGEDYIFYNMIKMFKENPDFVIYESGYYYPMVTVTCK